MLNQYRVLDLTDHRGEISGMILGDLGADVIKVEPPEGNAGRYQGPLIDDESVPASERSLQFAAYNRNKRSIVLDPTSVTDRGIRPTPISVRLLKPPSPSPWILPS